MCLTVSIGIIAYNEENCINNLFKDIISQTYPHNLIEIILVDGMSTDKTRELMYSFQNKYSNEFKEIKILENINRIQPSGLNIAINNFSSDLFIRIDSHANIPLNFVENNVNCIKSGEDICGGRIIKVINDTSKRKKILLMAENSMFGSGIAKYRHSTKKEYVKTIAHGCYKKEVFEKCGIFNEKIIRAEDNEFNYRVRKNGYKLCLDSSIYSEYHSRSSFSGMVKQKFGNGKWVGITTKLSPKIFSLYHYIPFLFVMFLILSLMLCIIPFFNKNLWFLSLPLICGGGLYLFIDILLSIKTSINYKEFFGILTLPFIFPILHISYGLGTLIGFIIMPFKKLK